MKKYISLILALAILISAFYGCSDNKAENEQDAAEDPLENIVEQELDIVVYDRENDSEYWNEIVSAFEENNPGVKVNMFIDKDAAYELRNRILGGASPDFVYLPSGEESGVTTALIKDRALLSLSDVSQTAKPLLFSGIFDNAISKPYDNDEIYLAPLFFNIKGMIYNKTLLLENGWTVPKTWDELVELAEECDKKKISIFGYAGAEPDEFTDMFAAAVGSAVGTEKISAMLNCESEAWEDESVNTFAGYIEKIKKLVADGSSKKTKDDAITSLKNGEVLFISGSLSDLSDFVAEEEESSANEYGFAFYPAIDIANRINVVELSEMYIPFEAKNPELAKKFLVFQYSDIAVNIAAKTLGEAAPVLKVANSAENYGFNEIYSSVYGSMGSENVLVPEFKIKAAENESLEDEFCSLIISIFKGNVVAEDFSSKMVEYLEDY